MSDEEISFNFGDLKESFSKASKWFKQRKVLTWSIILILAAVLIVAIVIRIQDIPNLVDHTTGKYIPLALDPFYFLREAQTMLQPGGLPPYDALRYPSLHMPWSPQFLPHVIILVDKIGLLFDPSMTLDFADVIYPVIFFALGWIAFFFFIYALTKSKLTALISSIFLAIAPSYLSMTIAGFARHEALGMFAFFTTLMVYVFVLRYFNKEGNTKIHTGKAALLGLAMGFLSSVTYGSWGGISIFEAMIIPIVFLLFWLVKFQRSENLGQQSKLFLFYAVMLASSIIFSVIYGYGFHASVQQFISSKTSIIAPFALLFFAVDIGFGKIKHKIKFIKKENLENRRTIYSIIIAVIIGLALLSVYKGGPVAFIGSIVHRLLYPFGTARVSLTVAENAQPYLTDWISQTGTIFFWLFVAGLVTLGITLSKGITKKKSKVWFIVFWLVLVSGMLFSRISPSSVLNGTSFLSRVFYFGSMILFAIYLIRTYIKEKVEFKPDMLLMIVWGIIMLISSRSAVRVLFIIAPFACFSVGYFLFNIGRYYKNMKRKDDLFKMFIILVLIGSIIASGFSFSNQVHSSVVEAKSTGTSADWQWQSAMAWVRNNTAPGSIFASWWDYGYWIQTLGKRPTVLDGSNHIAFWDHLMGRYVLTTPKPATALSFLKTHNVSYYLIDPSDLGKYPAYSKIGSGPDGVDRYSSVPIMPIVSGQTQTSGNTTTRIYQSGVPTDQDILYNLSNGQQVFMPEGQAYVIGMIMNTTSGVNNSITFGQPSMILYYNNQQFRMPMKYVYFNNHLIDFGKGFPGAAYVLPSVSPSGTSLGIDQFGSLLYLSPKVFSSFFAQLYLMNDTLGEYPTITLAHAQYDQLLQSMRSQGFTGEFIDYQGHFDGPIKIWHVSYPKDIIRFNGFLNTTGAYGEFDNVTFVNKSL